MRRCRARGAAELIDAVQEFADAADIDAHSASRIPGAVVIQGTDTIEETAWCDDLLVASDRPVVVTRAMRGPRMPGADGPANLLASTIVAASDEACGPGMLAVLNDEMHAARFVSLRARNLLSFLLRSAGHTPRRPLHP